MSKYVKVENGQVVGAAKVPKEVFDPSIDDHVKLDTEAKRKQYGYYKVEKPTLPDVTKVHGSPKYDANTDTVALEVVDRVYEDVYDEDGTTVVMTALEAMKLQRKTELREMKAAVREDAVDWIIKRFATNGQWSQAERKVFSDFYAQLDTWEQEVDTYTDVKALHKKVFDASTHRQKMRDLS